MSSNELLSNELKLLALEEAVENRHINTMTTESTALSAFPNQQDYTKRAAISPPENVIKAELENFSPLVPSNSIFQATTIATKQSHITTEDALDFTEPIAKLPLVVGTTMQLSFVKTANPDDGDLLAPLSKNNAEIKFLAAVPLAGEQVLTWVFNHVPDTEPAFENPLLEENRPALDVDGETAAEKSERLYKHVRECVEYLSASDAQDELGLMMKEAMDYNMFAHPIFPRFLDLAPEIQHMIWDMSMEEDRIIEVHIFKRCVDWMIVYASTDAKNPALLSVCKAARERGLLKYKALTIENSWRRDKKMYDDRQAILGLPSNFVGPEAGSTNFNCYINYDRDTIFINSGHCRIYSDALDIAGSTWRERFGYQFLKDLFFSPAGNAIQSLAIDYSLAEKFFDTGRNQWQYCQVIAAMPELKKLDIVWTGNHSLEHIFQKECCHTEQIKVEPGEHLSDEERYSMKFPLKNLHHRALKLHELKELDACLADGWIGERFASGQTSAAWKTNIVTAIRQNRPVNPAAYSPNSFHFDAAGNSRYRDLDDLEFSECCIERE